MGVRLPDKAISVLDTAAARVALTQNAQPVKLDQLQAQWHNLNLEQDILEKEQQNMPIHHERIWQLKAEISELAGKISDTQAQWQNELQLVKQD